MQRITREKRSWSFASAYHDIDIATDFGPQRPTAYSAASAKASRLSEIIWRISQTHFAHCASH